MMLIRIHWAQIEKSNSIVTAVTAVASKHGDKENDTRRGNYDLDPALSDHLVSRHIGTGNSEANDSAGS